MDVIPHELEKRLLSFIQPKPNQTRPSQTFRLDQPRGGVFIAPLPKPDLSKLNQTNHYHNQEMDRRLAVHLLLHEGDEEVPDLQTKPNQTKPSQAKPNKTKPQQTKQNKTTTNQTKPTS